MNRTKDLREFWKPMTLEKAKWLVACEAGDKDEYWKDEHQEEQIKQFLVGVIPNEGDKVLDFGCGVGRMSRQLSRMGCKVLGVDVSEEMLEYAREYCKDVGTSFLHSDGHGCNSGNGYGTASDTFDLVVSALVFQHMPSRAITVDCLSDIYRVLKHGGKACIQSRWDGCQGDADTASFVGVALKGSEFKEMCEEVGFKVIVFQDPVGDPKFNWYRLVLEK